MTRWLGDVRAGFYRVSHRAHRLEVAETSLEELHRFRFVGRLILQHEYLRALVDGSENEPFCVPVDLHAHR